MKNYTDMHYIVDFYSEDNTPQIRAMLVAGTLRELFDKYIKQHGFEMVT